MSTSNDGTVTGRPDDKWMYVVEIPASTNPGGDPKLAWVYTSTHESMDEAMHAATAVTGPVRVRSFKVQHMPADHGIDPSVFTSRSISGPDVRMFPFECIDHPEQKASVMETAKVPRCPLCKTTMSTPGFAAKVRAL